jgi:tricorn protease
MCRAITRASGGAPKTSGWRTPTAPTRRLTVHLGNDFAPRFSPDGKWIAFTSNRTGNNDVFTWRRPAASRVADVLLGRRSDACWAPDGKSIVISSNRGPFAFGSPLYRLPIDGGPAEPLPMPSARLGMLKQDGSALAYNRVLPSTGVWRKGFKGNSAPGLTVEDLKTGAITEITNGDMKDYQKHVNDVYPMWGADGNLYFSSERDGTYNLWRISATGANPQQVTHFKTDRIFDCG